MARVAIERLESDTSPSMSSLHLLTLTACFAATALSVRIAAKLKANDQVVVDDKSKTILTAARAWLTKGRAAAQ